MRIHSFRLGGTLSSSSSSSTSYNQQAPKFIGLACVLIVALAMLLSVYFMIARRRSRGSSSTEGIAAVTPPAGATNGVPCRIPVLTSSSVMATPASSTARLRRVGGVGETVVGTLQRTGGGVGEAAAYTITINSAGAAAELDEAILPLTEDKTRF